MTRKKLYELFEQLQTIGYEEKEYTISNVSIIKAYKHIVLGEEPNGCKHKIQYSIEYFHIESNKVNVYQKIAVYTDGQHVYPKIDLTIPIYSFQDVLANEQLEPQLVKLAAAYGIL